MTDEFAERQEEGDMTEEHIELDQDVKYEVVEADPEPEAPRAAANVTKPEWTLKKTDTLRYGSEGPEVDYVNRTLGVEAASFTRATEDAVKKYQSENRFVQTGEIAYVVYYKM